MGFGNSINTLLETYSNCIRLLKAFKHHDGNSTLGADDQKAQLRKSLKTDRKIVASTYSEKLSEAGKRFEKGDARSISIMERILKKLRAAIASLLRLSSRRGPALDYESLKSLSNASRIEAIHAIDHLSRRLGGSSTSHSSLVTYSSSSKTSSTSTSGSERPRGRRHNSSSSSSSSSSNSSPKLKKKKSSSSSSSSSHKSSRRTPTISEEGEEGVPPSPTRQRRPSRSSDEGEQQQQQQQQYNYYDETQQCPPYSYSYSVPYQVRGPSRGRTAQLRATAATTTATGGPNRISMMSVSSNSTKLGEIPEHKWSRPHHNNLAAADNYSSDEWYNVAPAYPLKPYIVPPPKQKPGGFFGGFFGRKRRGSN
ncbi:hypothetical protein V8F33_003330 [Rhypophila sp. PSN 637]